MSPDQNVPVQNVIMDLMELIASSMTTGNTWSFDCGQMSSDVCCQAAHSLPSLEAVNAKATEKAFHHWV